MTLHTAAAMPLPKHEPNTSTTAPWSRIMVPSWRSVVPTTLSMEMGRAFSLMNIRKVCPVMAAPTMSPMVMVTMNSMGTPWLP